jgi:hypothetical protein
MPAIVRTIPMATVAHTILRSAALADSTIARLTTTAATAATRNQATVVVEAAAIPSRAAIPRHQLLLVLTRVPRVHTLRLAAVMAAVAAVLAAAVVAEARTRPLVEAGLVVVEAALTAVVVAATPVVATNQRTY